MDNLKESLKAEIDAIFEVFMASTFAAFPYRDLKRLEMYCLVRLATSTEDYLRVCTNISFRKSSLPYQLANLAAKYIDLGLEPASFQAVRILDWLTSSEYEYEVSKSKMTAVRVNFCNHYKAALADGSRFGVGRMFDALLLISNNRYRVITPLSEKLWGSPTKGRYRSHNLQRTIKDCPVNYEALWSLVLGCKLIQANIKECLKFSYSNNLSDLVKVLNQIKHMDLSSVNEGNELVGVSLLYSLPSQVAKLKRIDAALDDVLVHILKKKLNIKYECTQLSKSSDHTFKCHRVLSTDSFMFINSGEHSDGCTGSSKSFYSLFTTRSFDELIAGVQGFFDEVKIAA